MKRGMPRCASAISQPDTTKFTAAPRVTARALVGPPCMITAPNTNRGSLAGGGTDDELATHNPQLDSTVEGSHSLRVGRRTCADGTRQQRRDRGSGRLG